MITSITIIAAAVLLLIVMARKYKGYRKLPFTVTTAGGTVAADDVTSATLSEVLTEERRILSIEATYALQGMAATDGPIEYGVAHSDYTAAEIEEALEATGAWDEGDKVAQEQAKRLVRQLGIFSNEETALNEGQPVKTRLNWRIATGDTLQFWIRNRGIQMTTGMEIVGQGVLHSVLV